MSVSPLSVLRLKVIAEADSGALLRVLERFHNLGVLPRRVIAEFTSADALSIQVDIAGVEESRMTLIAEKVGQIPLVSRAYWHYA
ncbi:MAG: hypothetical protein IRZ28_03425 [Steroidobacteraceae bacterium]|jgi:hypothetical protein|nr:hypothetical protein [Steroidobacteraceae bacterium]